MITGRTHATLEESAGQHENISFVVADIGVTEDVTRLIDAVRERHGRLDTLINNAGVAPVTPFAQATLQEYDRTFQANVRGLVDLTAQALPLLKETKGNVVNLSSAAVAKTVTNMSTYSASKAAVTAYTKVWAKEFASDGVRFNIVSPGPIETPIYSKTTLSADEVVATPLAAIQERGGLALGRTPVGGVRPSHCQFRAVLSCPARHAVAATARGQRKRQPWVCGRG